MLATETSSDSAPPGITPLTFEPPARFFINSGVVSNATDVYHLLRSLLKQSVVYRYLRSGELIAWGTGRVDRILVDRPDLASFFTPASICVNVGSFEYLEFETLPDGGLEYRLVQGDERVILQALPPGAPTGLGGDVQQTLELPGDEYVQLELTGLDSLGPRGDPGTGGAGGAEG